MATTSLERRSNIPILTPWQRHPAREGIAQQNHGYKIPLKTGHIICSRTVFMDFLSRQGQSAFYWDSNIFLRTFVNISIREMWTFFFFLNIHNTYFRAIRKKKGFNGP
jgi:hypothetical protein